MADNPEFSRHSTRRGFLLNRFAFTCGTGALVLAVFWRDPEKWTVVAVLAALAVASWWLGDKLDKKGRKTIEVDEKGNAKKKVL